MSHRTCPIPPCINDNPDLLDKSLRLWTMGEYADMAIDEGMNMEDEFDDYRNQGNSGRFGGNRNVFCKYCRKHDGFYWQLTPNGWRLFNKEGMHYCIKK